MKSIFKQFIFGVIRKRYKKKTKDHQANELSFRQEFNKARAVVLHNIRDFFLVAVSVVVAGFGLKGFLLPNSFIDGGVTGISLLARELTGIPLSVLLVIINLPFLVLGFYQVSRQLGIKSILAIIGLAMAVQFIPYPVVTSDKLLIAAFGGFFLGAGIGLAIRGGAVLDGTEVLAIYLSKRTGLTIGDIILVFNIVIFAFGAYVLSVEVALYAILTYLAASKTVDFVIEGVEEYTGVTIISAHSDAIRRAITENLGRGVTLYIGKGGFATDDSQPKPIDIVYTVITRLEIARLQTEIDKIDPTAFVITSSIKDTKGGMIKKKAFKHINKKQ